MPLTGAQITAFFENADQMGLSNRTRVYLQGQGIDSPDDLADFVKKSAWDQLLENCKRPPQIQNNAVPPVLVNDAAYQFPAKSLLRMKVAALAVQYYSRTGRALTAQSIMWSRLSNFQIEYDSIQETKDSNDKSGLPVISKQLTISKWFEAYETYVDEYIGQADCPLGWIYRESVAVAAVVPPLERDQPYSTEHGSVAEELVHRMSHDHALFRPDNATGYAQLVTATLGTQYASTIAPYKRTKNGRAAFIALKAQYSGPAHWDKEVSLMNDFLLNSVWTGTTAFTLHGFLAKHRASYNTLQRCAEHVAVELPNDRTRVGYILKNIECSDKDVTAALSHVRLDDNPGGMRQDFELAVAFLLPTDPVKKKRGGKRGTAQISAVIAAASGEDDSNDKGTSKKNVRFKANTGKTGVELRYHTHKEFIALSKEQRDELINHRKANGGYRDAWTGKTKSKGGGLKGKGSFKSRVSAVIKANEEEKEKEDARRTALIDEVKGIIAEHVSESTPVKRSRISNTNVAGAKGEAQVSAADQCANALMEKFLSMGTKAKKSG